MLAYIKQLYAERDTLTATATGITDTAAKEGRDLTDTEKASLASMQERCAALDGQLKTYGEQADSQRAYAELRSKIEAIDAGSHDVTPSRSPAVVTRDLPTWVDPLVTELERTGYNGRGSIELGDAPLLFERAPVMIDTFPGTLPPYYFTPVPWKPTTPMLDVCGRVTVSSNAIEWYEWSPGYPAAPVVPEGTAKPEMDYVPVPKSAALQTYAHHKPLSRQALEDIPQIRSIIETALRGGVLRALESAILAALTAGATGATPSIETITDPDLLTGIRLGLAHVQTNGYAQPNAVVLNPDDYATLDIRVMEETVTGPNITRLFWGLPVVVSADVVKGFAWVGDFRTAVTLFARAAMSVFMSDSHADYFVKNLLTLLAEQRAYAAVTAPPATCRVEVGTPVAASASAGKK